jgi:hypothetical protein
MKFQTLMIIKAVVCLALGVPILFAPVFAYSLFGLSLNAAGAIAAQEYGASLIGNMLVTWFARNAVESKARRAIILGLCVYDAIGLVIMVIALILGLGGPLVWFAVAIYLFFAVGYGYFLFKSPKP